MGEQKVNWRKQMEEMARASGAASEAMRQAPISRRNAALLAMAERLQSKAAEIAAANSRDKETAKARGLQQHLINRLDFGERKIAARIVALQTIANLEDPLSETEEVHRENGLRAVKRRVPIGVVGVIYEARPHVTINAGALGLKAGNALLLKGGSEALNCNRLLGELWQESLAVADLPREAIQVIGTSDRAAVRSLLELDEYVDLIIPRGGPGLIDTVSRGTAIPVIKHSHGICHIFVEAEAEIDAARALVVDSKVYAPSVCNALETLLVEKAIAPRFLPLLAKDLQAQGVVLRGCEETRQIIEAEPATEDDWATEYLDLVLAIKVVGGIEEAIEHISTYGSGHTDAIVSKNQEKIRRFADKVDSGVVMANVSTMFNDASKLGMGAEIGISSDKIHARGPMGVKELTCQKWVIEGDGHIFEGN